MDHDPFDNLETLKMTPEQVAARQKEMRGRLVDSPRTATLRATKAKKRKETEAEFIMMPMKIALKLSGKVSGAAWAIMCCLVNLEYKAIVKNQPVVLSNIVLQKWGISRLRKTRALAELKDLGVITVEQKLGMAPRVVIVL